MELPAGTRLGPYEIASRLGAGGMGEVYKAVDTRLGRSVAIKILPRGIDSGEAAKRRFAREARAISALNHPHICSLYDVGHDNGHEYLVMEYLAGETLAERLTRGPLSEADALQHGIEIASALERAHRQGIIHRDLKPANVMLLPSGAKLLDFGLARMTEAAGSAAAPLTGDETMIGTIEYMAPEQLRGGDVDARADIFSFGVLLYEMLTGRRPFGGHNRASVIGAILFSPAAPIHESVSDVPVALERLIDACLAKEPDDRIQTAHDLLLQLRWIAAGAEEGATPRSRPVRRRSPAWTWGAVGFAVGAIAASAAAWRLKPATERQVRFAIQSPVAGEEIDWPIVSPDGTKLAFVSTTAGGERSLWVRDLASTVARKLPGTADATQPFWSADGKSLAFFSVDKLQILRIDAARPQTLATASSARGGSWNASGTILYTPHVNAAVWRVDAMGTEPRPVTRLDATHGDLTHRWPEFLPDGDHFLFVIRSTSSARSGLYVGSLSGGEPKKISVIQTHAVVSPSGWMFSVQDRRLVRQRFDLRALKLSGEPVMVASGIEPDLKVTGAVRLSVSADDTLAFASPRDTRTTIVWENRRGAVLGTVAPSGYYVNPALSPDGQTLAVSRIDEVTGRNSLWMIDTTTGAMSPFVNDQSNADAPAWSPDGRRVVYVSDRSGHFDVYERSVGSVAADRLVLSSTTYAQPVAVARTGTLYNVAKAPSGSKYLFWRIGEPSPRSLEDITGAGAADLSRDGRWFASMATRTDTSEFGIQIVSVDHPDQRVFVGAEGGSEPTWRPDGRELYYVDAEHRVVAVAFNGGTIGGSTPLFPLSMDARFYSNRSFAPSADGGRFIVLQPAPSQRMATSTVVLHCVSD